MGLISDNRPRRRASAASIRELCERALALSKLRSGAIVEDAIAIASVPSPTGQERARSGYVADLFRQRGLLEVITDDLGNTVARLPGLTSGPPLLIAAHIDTVFPLDTPLTIERADGRVHGPGIGDNSLGVAATIALVGLFDELGVRPAVDVLLTGNVGEEGLGDLRGIRRVMDDRPEIGAVIAVEGHNLGRVTHVAVGSKRMHVTVTSEGGHSWGDAGASNAIQGAAEIIHELYRIPLPANPKTTLNVGMIEGGTSINTIPSTAWFNIDLRSVEAHALRRLAERVERVISTPRHGLSVQCEIVGDRPAGIVPSDCRLVQLAIEALDSLGVSPAGDASSTDANIPISRGVPAICVGLTTGGGVHREDEFIELAPFERGLAQLIALTIAASNELQRGVLHL